MRKLPRVHPLCIALSFLILSTFSYGQTQSKVDEDGLLQALLNEVRLLRQTIQNTNLYAYRGQIIIERIRAQRDRVTRLTNTLEDVRGEINNLAVQGPHLEERIKELSERIENEADTKQRAELENEFRAIKQAVSLGKQREEELRKRESLLTATLSEEQAKLENLENRLELLESELERNIESQKEKKSP